MKKLLSVIFLSAGVLSLSSVSAFAHDAGHGNGFENVQHTKSFKSFVDHQKS